MNEDVVYCARHPSVETPLRCGRCDTPICPRCLVQTPVGARCRDCAGVRMIPTYNIKPITFVRGLAAGVGAGVAMGAAWGYLLSGAGGFGFFGFFIGIFIGYIIAESIGMATNRRMGPIMGGIGIFAAIVTYFTRNAVAGIDLLPQGDVGGYVVAAVAAFFAWTRLAR